MASSTGIELDVLTGHVHRDSEDQLVNMGDQNNM